MLEGEKKKKNAGRAKLLQNDKNASFFCFDSFTEGRERRGKDLEMPLKVTFGERGKD